MEVKKHKLLLMLHEQAPSRQETVQVEGVEEGPAIAGEERETDELVGTKCRVPLKEVNAISL